MTEKSSTNSISIITTLFDWDDTLLPTSFIQEVRDKEDKKGNLPKEIQQKLDKHDDMAKSLVEMFNEKGEVRILTNASFDWIHHSAEKYIPKTYKLLDELGALKMGRLFSGYDFHTGKGDTNKWKLNMVFEQIKPYLETLTKKKVVENNGAYVEHYLISIGDSLQEKEAIVALAEDSASSEYAKNYKFIPKTVLIDIDKSSIGLLTRSLQLIRANRKVLLIDPLPVHVTLSKKNKKKETVSSRLLPKNGAE